MFGAARNVTGRPPLDNYSTACHASLDNDRNSHTDSSGNVITRPRRRSLACVAITMSGADE